MLARRAVKIHHHLFLIPRRRPGATVIYTHFENVVRQLQPALSSPLSMMALRALLPVSSQPAQLTDHQVIGAIATAVVNGQTHLSSSPGDTSITFNGSEEIITISAADVPDQAFDASNNPDSHLTIGKLVNGSYDFYDTTSPHRHENKDDDSHNGKYGPGGIFRLKPFKGADGKMHQGVAVHAGRAEKKDGAGRQGFRFATEGCIRTTEEAITYITGLIAKYPLSTLTVVNNRAKPKGH